MSILKKLAGETAIYGFSSILGRFLNYGLVPLHVRILNPSEYGIVSELFAWAGFLMVIFMYRLDTGFFRFGSNKADRSTAYTTALYSIVTSSVLLISLVIFFSTNIAQWFQYPDKSIYFVFFALILGIDVICEIPFAKLRLDGKAKRFATIRILNIVVNFVFNIFFLIVCPWILKLHDFDILKKIIQSFYDPTFGVGYVFLCNLIASATTLLLLLPEISHTDAKFDTNLWRRMVAYSLPLIIVSLAGIVNETMDRSFLKHYLPYSLQENLSQIGIYSGCYKLAILVSLFTQAFRMAAEPFFFAQASNKDAPENFAQVSRYFSLVGAFAFVGIMLYIDVIKYVLQERYWEGLGIVPIVLIANICLGLYYNFSVWYRIKDRNIIGSYIAVGGAIITIGLNIWWIPLMGYFGSAWATLVCYVFMMSVTYWIGQRYFPVPYPIGRMALYVGLAIACYGLSVLLHPLSTDSLLLRLAINSGLVVLFTLSIIYYFEKSFFKIILSKYIK